jgi:hypothetical protein
MTMPLTIFIKTALKGSDLEHAVDQVIAEFSENISEKLIWFYGGGIGTCHVADADLCALMEGHTPKSGAWSACHCPDLEAAEDSMTPEYFSSLMKSLIHVDDTFIIIEERNDSFGFQEQYDFLYKKLSILQSAK